MPIALDERSHLWIGWLSALAVPLLGLVDYVTGYDLSFSLFYLAPITLASWFVGRKAGVLVSAASAFVWIAADAASGHVVSSPFIYVWNTLIRFGFFLTVTTLLSRLKQSYERESIMARTDRTTGCANLRRFTESAGAELERTRRFGQPLTVAYMDLDNFKIVNDTHGHHAGDEVLRSVARVAMGRLRSIDIIARIGGDEFALLLPHTGHEGAQAIMAEIREALLAEMKAQGWPVTFSIGVVTFNEAPASVDDMIGAADKLMYAVKASSKNALRFDVQGVLPAGRARTAPDAHAPVSSTL